MLEIYLISIVIYVLLNLSITFKYYNMFDHIKLEEESSTEESKFIRKTLDESNTKSEKQKLN